jgi:ligand-binding sensor domain-containing protein
VEADLSDPEGVAMLLLCLLIASTLAAEIRSLGGAPLRPDPLASSPAVAPDGTLWLVQGDGLISVDTTGEGWSSVRSQEIVEGATPERILFDREGALWVAFDEGSLARHDGEGWTRSAARPWAGQAITALFRDPRAGIWLTTEAGLWRPRGDTWVPVEAARGAPQALWLEVEQAWLAYPDCIARLSLDGDEAECVSAPPAPARDLVVDQQGLWLATEDGLWRQPPDDPGWVLALEHSVTTLQRGETMHTAGPRGVWSLQGGVWEQIHTPRGGVVDSLSLGSDGALWVNDSQRVHRYPPSAAAPPLAPAPIGELEGGPSTRVVHGAGQTWVVAPGSWWGFDEGSGEAVERTLSRHPQPPSAPFRQVFTRGSVAWGLGRELHRLLLGHEHTQRWHSGPATALAVSQDGRPWLQIRDQLWAWGPSGWRAVPLPVLDGSDQGAAQAPGGSTWPTLLGTQGGQVLLVYGGQVFRWNQGWRDLGRPLDAEWSPGPALDADDGGLWLGSAAGLLELDRQGLWRHHQPPSRGAVTALLEGRDGTLWVGTSAGLCALSAHGDWRVASSLAGRSVQSVFEQDDGSLLVDLAGHATLRLQPEDLRVGPTTFAPAHLRWRDPAGRVWTSSAEASRWSDGIWNHTVVGPPSPEEARQHPGGRLVSSDPVIVLAEGAAAWFSDGRWTGHLHRSSSPVALLDPRGATPLLLLANGTLLEGSASIPLALGHASGLVRWNDAVCASGSLGLLCQDQGGDWTPRPGIGRVVHMAEHGGRLYLLKRDGLWRLGRRGPARPLADTGGLDGAATVLLMAEDGTPWVGTDAGVVARLGRDDWEVIHRFDAPIRGLAYQDASLVVRAGDVLWALNP